MDRLRHWAKVKLVFGIVLCSVLLAAVARADVKPIVGRSREVHKPAAASVAPSPSPTATPALSAGAPQEAASANRVGSVDVDLGKDWSCRLEDSDVFCTKGPAPYAELVVVAAHAKTKGESLAAFQKHLKEPRKFTAADGKKFVSEVRSVKRVKIDGHDWVDGLHYQSEVPGYFTHYFATVEDGQTVLATVSFHKELQPAYEAKAAALVARLRFGAGN